MLHFDSLGSMVVRNWSVCVVEGLGLRKREVVILCSLFCGFGPGPG